MPEFWRSCAVFRAMRELKAGWALDFAPQAVYHGRPGGLMFRFFSQPWSCLLRFAFSAVVLVLVGCRQNPTITTASGSCENLTSLSLSNTTITTAQTVAAGAFTPPAPANATNPPTPFVDLPAFCRVTATIKSAGSDVKSEVWIPAQGWNGDLQPAGAGFWGGSIPFARMREILRTGAATH